MRILLLFTLLFSASCSTTKNEVQLADRFFDLFDEFRKQITDSHISKIAGERPELPAHFKLAVYFKGPEEKSKYKQDWKWTKEDKEKLLSALHPKKGKLGRVFELIDTGTSTHDVKGLRVMAAQQGADALLLVQGMSEVDSPANASAITYVALIPTLFVNGNTVEGTFLAQAVMWDVKEPYVYLGVQNEGDYSHKRPLVFRQIPRVIRKSKEESLDGLTKKLKTEIHQI